MLAKTLRFVQYSVDEKSCFALDKWAMARYDLDADELVVESARYLPLLGRLQQRKTLLPSSSGVLTAMSSRLRTGEDTD